eukprot:TRINITY_DN23029_c0_g1_i2.p1 TRINITY_DN23029_c0_g1~~TRINITY_DN23029_c0_g1_i2.p1  ORF type:complete len:299 (+),score=63.96 TRINITY_DN23029_c0_g1_i2:106-1002(+)
MAPVPLEPRPSEIQAVRPGLESRPDSCGATTRRRPAPKVITDGAVQLGSSPSGGLSPLAPLRPNGQLSPVGAAARNPRQPPLGPAGGLLPDSRGSSGGSKPSSAVPVPAVASTATGQAASARGEAKPKDGREGSAAKGAGRGRPPAPARQAGSSTTDGLPLAPGMKDMAPGANAPGIPAGLAGALSSPFGGLQENPHCSVSAEGYPASEIRTKVFRMGAPLLRSTIPVSLGRGYGGGYGAQNAAPVAEDTTEKKKKKGTAGGASSDSEPEDVETVLSVSEGEGPEEAGHLAVTLDFPC